MRHDELWKIVLSACLPDFMRTFLPDAASRLDLATVQPMDKEVFTDLPEGARREPDVLVEMQTTDGQAELVLIHIEVQAARDSDVPFRMWEYYSLLRLRLRKPVYPIVLYLCPGVGGLVKARYEEHVLGQPVLSFQYSVVGPADLVAADYEHVDNAFAPAVSALMQAPGEDRARRKLRALQRLYRVSTDDARRSLLQHVVDKYLTLTDTESERFAVLLHQSGLEDPMGNVTSWEDYLIQQGVERGMERGVAQGAALGARRTLLRLLRAKFGELPAPAAMRIEQIEDAETLEALFERGLAADTLEQMRLDELPTGTPN